MYSTFHNKNRFKAAYTSHKVSMKMSIVLMLYVYHICLYVMDGFDPSVIMRLITYLLHLKNMTTWSYWHWGVTARTWMCMETQNRTWSMLRELLISEKEKCIWLCVLSIGEGHVTSARVCYVTNTSNAAVQCN